MRHTAGLGVNHVFGIILEHNMNGSFRDAPRLKDIIERTCDGLASVTALKLFRMQDEKSSLIHSAVKLMRDAGLTLL